MPMSPPTKTKLLGVGIGIGVLVVGVFDLLVDAPTPIVENGMKAIGFLFIVLGILTILFFIRRRPSEDE